MFLSKKPHTSKFHSFHTDSALICKHSLQTDQRDQDLCGFSLNVCFRELGQTLERHAPVTVFILITWECSAYTQMFTAYLYFHGHLPAIFHLRQVNLADGRSCKRTVLKRLQLVPPVRTEVAVQCFLQTDTNILSLKRCGVKSEFTVGLIIIM